MESSQIMDVLSTLAFGLPGGSEWIILLVLGLLIFGRRLPEVGRSLGRGIVEFKKGVKGIEEEIDDASSENQLPPPAQSPKLDTQSAESTPESDPEKPFHQPSDPVNG